jgi:hypothetical protein
MTRTILLERSMPIFRIINHSTLSGGIVDRINRCIPDIEDALREIGIGKCNLILVGRGRIEELTMALAGSITGGMLVAYNFGESIPVREYDIESSNVIFAHEDPIIPTWAIKQIMTEIQSLEFQLSARIQSLRATIERIEKGGE